MCVTSMFTCNCECHNETFGLSVRHVMACCHICPTCGDRIVTSMYDFHTESCKEDREETATLFGQQSLDFG